ncbi:UNVERIFIED_CONTAM: hypothetical protein FKN15_073157 [Acipenser sinensis]
MKTHFIRSLFSFRLNTSRKKPEYSIQISSTDLVVLCTTPGIGAHSLQPQPVMACVKVKTSPRC